MVTMGTNRGKNAKKHIRNFQILGKNLGLLWETEVKTDGSMGQRAERPVQADLRQARWRAQDALLSLITASVLSSVFFPYWDTSIPQVKTDRPIYFPLLLSAGSHPPTPCLA